jgi:hypothetical protein
LRSLEILDASFAVLKAQSRFVLLSIDRKAALSGVITNAAMIQVFDERYCAITYIHVSFGESRRALPRVAHSPDRSVEFENGWILL